MYFKNKYRIPSARRPEYDYAADGYYFITIIVHNRQCVFGEIKKGEMVLNGIGKIIESEWLKTFLIRANIIRDEFIIMPNHFHGILRIKNNDNFVARSSVVDVSSPVIRPPVETHCNASLRNRNTFLRCQNVVDDKNDPRINSGDRGYKNKFGPQINNLSSIIRGFKSSCHRIVNRQFPSTHFQWQSRYHDRIIRNDAELNRIRKYIKNNPVEIKNPAAFVCSEVGLYKKG